MQDIKFMSVMISQNFGLELRRNLGFFLSLKGNQKCTISNIQSSILDSTTVKMQNQIDKKKIQLNSYKTMRILGSSQESS